MDKRPIVVIAGPTASGKSTLAMRAAELLSGEIISADSMQIYRGLDIGTAKPSPEDRAKVRHHLVDLLDISEPLNVYRYVGLAESAVRDIRGRNKTPIVAGGTGLFVRSLLYGLDPLPADDGLKAKIQAEFGGEEGFERLLALMMQKDPAAAEKWRGNRRRLMRAFEVLTLAGRSILELQKTWKGELKEPAIGVFLKWERDELRRRIEARTDQMLAAGWIDEAARMIGRGLLDSPTAWQAIGYGIIGRHLGCGTSFEEMRAGIIGATWRLARRQETWFRNKHPELKTVEMPADLDGVVEEIRRRMG